MMIGEAKHKQQRQHSVAISVRFTYIEASFSGVVRIFSLSLTFCNTIIKLSSVL